MRYALQITRRSPPAQDKFCVGACLVDESNGTILSNGYSTELPGNRPDDPGRTHAGQCCLTKVADQQGVDEARRGSVLPFSTVLYTTMDPCNSRLTGNRPCVYRLSV